LAASYGCARKLVMAACAVLLGASPGLCFSSDDAGAGSARATIEMLTSIVSIVDGTPQWSPDGSRIMFESSSGKPGLWTVGANGGSPPSLLFSGSDIQIPKWSPDGKWIAYLSAKSGYPELWLWNVAAGNERQFTRLGARINTFNWSPDAKWIAFSADRYGSFDIWKASVADGQVYRLTAASQYSTCPSWSPDSKNIIYVRADDRWVDHDIVIMPASGGVGRIVVHDSGWFDYGTIWTNSTFGTPQISPNGNTVLFSSYRNGWVNYWTIELTGSQPRALAPEQADQTAARWSPDGTQVAYVSNHDGTLQLHLVGAGGEHQRVLVDPQVGVVTDPEWSSSGDRVSYTLGTPRKPADLFTISVKDGSATQLTFSVPDSVRDKELVMPEKVNFPSPDGSVISAYLYKPANHTNDQKFPGILWIHGGPTSQFTDTYAPLVQFLVMQGYVILMPNIRGSSGFGKKFEDANNGCWGHCDLDDVLAGVKYLKTLPFINPRKMGITGTSYGGCMSMDAVAFAPGVFQAAIPMSGYGDWVSFMSYNTELRHTKLLAYELGPFPERADLYRKVSPIYSVNNVTTPVFLVQGDGPPTAWRPGEDVPPASVEFARALEAAYKVYRFKAYVNRGEPTHYGPYYVSGRENTEQLGLDMLDFFDQYLKDSVIDASFAGIAPGGDTQ
jgi:dipeptidyl aminopeptidase/acylaminoacyl peptidase